MDTIGIICEYNPLHKGHEKQIRQIRQKNDAGIVCLMSGNFVQRGEPAIVDKSLRAEAAIRSGADLVLEMPVTASLSSAEGFAEKCVSILSPFCQELSFGAEHPEQFALMTTAEALLSDAFSPALRQALDTGISFPAARQKALESMGCSTSLLTSPNDILAVEYCKAILRCGSKMRPAPIRRMGDYHAEAPDAENPSATSLRRIMEEGGDVSVFIPQAAIPCFQNAPIHTLQNAERAILAKLRTMTDEEFEAVPYGSEGLWRKLMHASRQCATLEELFSAVKSKRYTYTRISRMVLCAFLGITAEQLNTPAPYVRVLAFNERGRQILKDARQHGTFLNAGEKVDDPYQQLENRCGDLYGLFSSSPEAPGVEGRRRVVSL